MSDETGENEAGEDELAVGGRRAWLLQALGAAVALGAAGASISCAKKEEPPGGAPEGAKPPGGAPEGTNGGAADTNGATNAGTTGVPPERLWCVEDLDFEGDTLVIKNVALADSMERVKFTPGHKLWIKRPSKTHPGQKVNVIC